MASRYSVIQTNFTAGEFSPRLEGRVDISKYANSVHTLENMLVWPHGGTTRRPGTRFVAETKDSTQESRLIPFVFNEAQSYALEVGNNYIRFFSSQGQIYSGVTPYEVATPYTAAQVAALKHAASADVMYLAHPNVSPRKLSRLGHTNWTLSTITFTGTTNALSPPTAWTGTTQPNCVAFYEDRLAYAGTAAKPQTIWFSTTGNYKDFTTGVDDDNALIYTMASDRVDRIFWMVPQQILFVGTMGSEWTVSAASGSDALSPTSVKFSRQTTYGSSDHQAKLVNSVVLFTALHGRKLRELQYTYSSDSFSAPDLTLLAEHITEGGIASFDYQAQPDSTIWAVRNDGVLLGCTYYKTEDVVAWSRHITDGEVESLCVIPGTNQQDEVWMIVKRTIGGVTKRYVEFMEVNDFGSDVRDSFFVDSGLTYNVSSDISGVSATNPVVITTGATHSLVSGNYVLITGVEGISQLDWKRAVVGAPTANTFTLQGVDGTGFSAYTSGGIAEKMVTSISGLDHLEGKTVSILADGAVHPTKVVASGAITLDYRAARVHVGLPFTSRVVTMRPEVSGSGGTSQGKIKSINSLVLRFYRTVGCKVGLGETDLDRLPFRTTSDIMGQPVPLFTGDKLYSAMGGWDREARVWVEQDQPLPMSLLAIMTNLTITEQ